MGLINVGELINDPDFSQSFKVNRKQGSWNAEGLFDITESSFNITGVVTPQNSKELELLPDGSPVRGRIILYTKAVLYPTKLVTGSEDFSSDELLFHNQTYTITQADDYSNYGYLKYIAMIKQGANEDDNS